MSPTILFVYKSLTGCFSVQGW